LSNQSTWRDGKYLADMLLAAERADRHRTRVTEEQFRSDELVQDAVVYSLQVIGEAARMVSAETRLRLSEIPWTEIIGMRNRLVHEYGDIDLDIAWNAVNIDVPRLIELLTPIVNES
jgi:uncharacterized protein with HEPN domain